MFSKQVSVGEGYSKFFKLDSVAKVMKISEPSGMQGRERRTQIVGVGPFQAAGMLFAQVGLEHIGNPDGTYKIVSVLPAKLDHWAEVESSQIAAIAFDWLSQTLRVKFHGRVKKDGSVTPGSTYSYEDVPAVVVGEMLFAVSVGSAFQVLIKSGGFRYEKEYA